MPKSRARAMALFGGGFRKRFSDRDFNALLVDMDERDGQNFALCIIYTKYGFLENGGLQKDIPISVEDNQNA